MMKSFCKRAALLLCVLVGGSDAFVHHSGGLVVTSRRVSTPAMSMKLYDWKRREADESSMIRVDSMEFRVDNIRGAPGSKKRRTRKGRGNAAGQGSSCGFGMRGQKSRSGRPARPGFEGGQTPLYRLLPKLVGRPTGPGHENTIYSLVSLDQLARASPETDVDYEALEAQGLVTKKKHKIYKVVGTKDPVDLPKGLKVKAHAFTTSARNAIETAGGTCLLINKNTNDLLVEA